jgi:hypothetical protein
MQAVNSPVTLRLPSVNGAGSVFVRRLTGAVETIEGYYRSDIAMTEFSATLSGVYAYSEAGAMTEEPEDEPEETEAPEETAEPIELTPIPTQEPEATITVGDTIRLFMYIGIGLLAVCAIAGAAVVIVQQKNKKKRQQGRHRK